MNKIRIDYVERKFHEGFSLEKAFRQIEAALDQNVFEGTFEQLPFLNTALGVIKNLLVFRPKKGADIYHITGHAHYICLLFPRRNTVLSIMDLRFVEFGSGLRRFLLKKLYLDLPMRKLEYITAISEQTRDEIIHHTGCDPAKVRVLELPLLDYLSDETGDRPYNSTCPRILHIGVTPNKNIPNLAKALNGIRCILVIIGRLDEIQRRSLAENEIEVENMIDLEDDQLREEYRKADVVSFCSTYEGFGLPIIEAQAMRKPVITSDLSPMKETSGGAAVLVDPHDSSSIREGFLKLAADGELRQRLVGEGLRNVERFAPKTVAAGYADLYKEIVEKKKGRKPDGV